MAGRLSGIHGAHLGHIEFISTDNENQTIPWVAITNDDGSVREFVSPDTKVPEGGQKHSMNCIDCHNRAAHSFDTPVNALNKAMASGRLNASLPFLHKEGLALMQSRLCFASRCGGQDYDWPGELLSLSVSGCLEPEETSD